MAKSSGDRDYCRDGVCRTLALLLLYLLSEAWNLEGGQPDFPRGREVPLVGSYGTWTRLDDALASASGNLPIPPNIDPEGHASGNLPIPPNIDPEGQYNIPPVDQLPVMQDPLENIDEEADLNMWLAVAEVVNLPRQIERDEANMLVTRPQVPSSVAESDVAPLSFGNDVVAGALQHPPSQSSIQETVAADTPAPDVVGIPAGVLPQRVEAEIHGEAQEVVMEAFPPGMLQLVSDVARLPRGLPQFATLSMAVPAGDLESNLEERIPMDQPEAGEPSYDPEAKIDMQADDVQNLGVGEPRAEGMK